MTLLCRCIPYSVGPAPVRSIRHLSGSHVSWRIHFLGRGPVFAKAGANVRGDDPVLLLLACFALLCTAVGQLAVVIERLGGRGDRKV